MGRLVAPLRVIDRRPVLALVGVTVLATGGLVLMTELADNPVLLARADAETRRVIYGQLSQSGVTMLAAALTALAVLLALPDRPRIEKLRATTGWRLLPPTLLATAALCGLVTAVAHVATAIDTEPGADATICALLLGLAAGALVAVVVAGIAFALTVVAISDESAGRPDPASGRGA